MVNLLSNAIKYSPPGGAVDVSSHVDAQRLRVTVRDRGPGIPLESQSLIFERFHRIESDPLQQREGTGLGLCLCKYIVEKHDGCIGVESKIGQGSTFWFRIPVMS
jgi:signal transduction histidine kinase